jgi:peptidoglycan/LPS O-acetylase OafA/YrhL
MRSASMPRLQFLKQSQLGEDSFHSILITLLRGLAAIQVAAAHLRAEIFPSLRAVPDPSLWYTALAFATGFAHQAVLVFFLISGWLVGGSLLNKMGQPHAIKSYAIDRVTRLWTVLIPTFVLILLFGVGMDVLSTQTIDYSAANEYSMLSFLGNLFGLQTILVPNFGHNYALWSLANETWYYILFPLCVLLFTARTLAGRLSSALAIVLMAAFLPYAIVLYFAIWLLGAAFSRVRVDCITAVRVVLFILLAAVSVYYRLTGANDDMVPGTFVQDLICSIAFLLFLCSLQFKPKSASRLSKPMAMIGKFFSEFSFTLYVLHVPLIGVLRYAGKTWFGRQQLSPHAVFDLVIYFGMLATLLAGAYLSYLLFESQTYRLRRLVKRILLQRPVKLTPVHAVHVDS